MFQKETTFFQDKCFNDSLYPASAKLDKSTYVKENQNVYCISQTFLKLY